MEFLDVVNAERRSASALLAAIVVSGENEFAQSAPLPCLLGKSAFPKRACWTTRHELRSITTSTRETTEERLLMAQPPKSSATTEARGYGFSACGAKNIMEAMAFRIRELAAFPAWLLGCLPPLANGDTRAMSRTIDLARAGRNHFKRMLAEKALTLFCHTTILTQKKCLVNMG
jgi:hypothetical protein